MKHSHWCRNDRASPPVGAKPALIGEVLQYGGVLGEHGAVVEDERGHEPEWVHTAEVAAVGGALRLPVDLDEVDRNVRFVRGDPRAERTGERIEVELHAASMRIGAL